MNITPAAPAPSPVAIALTVCNTEARIDSRQLADCLGLKHESVFKTIKENLISFKKLGKVEFQIGASSSSATGQRARFALLTEDQAYFLLTMSRNTPRVVDLKLELVKAFRATRLALAAYREGTLPSTKALNDAIHAVPGGPGPWLHSNVSRLVNATAGIAAGSRETSAAVQQAMLTWLQGIAAHALAGAVDAKDAYSRVKDALGRFGSPALMLGTT